MTKFYRLLVIALLGMLFFASIASAATTKVDATEVDKVDDKDYIQQPVLSRSIRNNAFEEASVTARERNGINRELHSRRSEIFVNPEFYEDMNEEPFEVLQSGRHSWCRENRHRCRTCHHADRWCLRNVERCRRC